MYYFALINGKPNGYISHFWLKQGDLVSPYLFLFYVEGLGALLRIVELDKHIWGVISCNGGPWLTHLLFTDDSLLFCKAFLTESQTREHGHDIWVVMPV